QVRRGKRVANDETNPRVNVLRLSGIARVAKGFLRVRNRIYERVFDAAWVRNSLPDAEAQRQRRAYRLGGLRASSITVAILLLLGGLIRTFEISRRALSDVSRAKEANQLLQHERDRANKERDRANLETKQAQRAQQNEKIQHDRAESERKEALKQRQI